MFHINADVRRPWKLSRHWFNRVAAFLNNLCGDGIICVNRPDEPLPDRPVSLSLNLQGLRDKFVPMLDFRAIPFTLKPIMNGDNIVSIAVFMPSTTVKYIGDSYSMASSAATATQPTGWYIINGITNGTIYINRNNANTSEWSFGTSEATGTNMWSVKIGSVSSSGVVTQFPVSMRGDSIIKDDATISREANKTKINTDGEEPNSDYPQDDYEDPEFEPLEGVSWNIGDKEDTEGIPEEQKKEVGCKVKVFSRVKYDEDNGMHYFYFREWTISKAGIVIKIDEEEEPMIVMA